MACKAVAKSTVAMHIKSMMTPNSCSLYISATAVWTAFEENPEIKRKQTNKNVENYMKDYFNGGYQCELEMKPTRAFVGPSIDANIQWDIIMRADDILIA